MAKSSSEYWEKRIASKTWKTYNSLEDRNRELLDFYTDASEAVKQELYDIAEKHSKDGVLTLSDMHKQNRLTELNKKYEQIALDLGKRTEKSASRNMKDGFVEVYKNTAAGMGDEDFSMPNKKLMDKLLSEPWRGDSFSSRLWKKQKKLAVGLNDILLTGLQQGKTVTEMAVSLHNFVGNCFNDCHRLVRTETMHYLNSATLQRYKDTGVKYVQILAASDERTCDICGVGGYHGKVYPIGKCPVLPFHANCRCTIIPCFDKPLNAAANDAIRNTNKSVKYNDSNNYSLNLNGYSEHVNKEISRCAREVAKLGSEDGKEHLHLVDVMTGKQSYYEKGEEGEVGGENFWKFIENHKSGKYAFIHNHNKDGYFSETDLRTLFQNQCVEQMIAVRNDAVIYVAECGKNIPTTGFYDDLYADELKKLNEDVRNGTISLADRSIKREEIIVDGLLRDYTKKGRLVEFDGRKKRLGE